MSKVEARAKAALNKPAPLGPDIDMAALATTAPQSTSLSDALMERAAQVGFCSTERERAGSYVQQDASVLMSASLLEGVEIMPIAQALECYPWARELMWAQVAPDADKYTAHAALAAPGGYFIRALAGARPVLPLQACLLIDTTGSTQSVHNLIVAEEGSELHIITGCASASHVQRALHIGVSEFYIAKGATVSFTMVHAWGPMVGVRPRTGATLAEGAKFINNYICLSGVGTLQSYPTIRLEGPGATAHSSSIIVAPPGSEIDIGARIILSAPGCRAQSVARAITTGGRIYSRGHMVGAAPDTRGHLECRGLMLHPGGSILAVPELEALSDGAELSHEAAVGKIAREELAYLMCRGLTEDEATSAIVRGFMDVSLGGLPRGLADEIKRTIDELDISPKSG